MFGQPLRHAAEAKATAQPDSSGDPLPSSPMDSAAGLSPASLQAGPPAASGKTAFTNNDFPKGEPSVFPLAAGTWRHDAAGGQEPVPRLSARSERPRLSGPEQAEGDRTMEGIETTPPPHAIASLPTPERSPGLRRQAARKPRPATSSPPSKPCNRSSGRSVPPPSPSGRRSPASAASGPWPCRCFPIPSPAATRMPAGRPSATSSNRCCRPSEYDSAKADNLHRFLHVPDRHLGHARRIATAWRAAQTR